MKKPIFTRIDFLDTVSDKLKTMTRAFSIIITITLINILNVNAQNCNVVLACSNGVHISLDENCETIVTPDMVMENPIYDEDYYDVTGFLLDGTPVNTTVVGTDVNGKDIVRVVLTEAYINTEMEILVSLRGCGNYCWGFAYIEDKLPPVLVDYKCEQLLTGFTGNISDIDGQYDRPAVDDCSGGITAGVYFETHSFALDADATVTISNSNPGVRISIYQGDFNPFNPCDNLIVTNKTYFSGNLLGNTNYYVVVSSVGGSVPPGGIDYALFIGSLDANVKSSSDASLCIRECNTEDDLLNETANNAPDKPLFVDACSGETTLTKEDEVITLTCSDKFSSIVKRTWSAIDVSGNISDDYVQYFYFKRLSMDDVICPETWVGTCGSNFKSLPNGAPVPEVSGYPDNISCHNIMLDYCDIVFELCGSGIKVRREWTIIDWCTSEDKLCVQDLVIMDNIAPIVNCPTDKTIQYDGVNYSTADVITVSPNSCTASWQVLPPVTIFDCSKITWDVSFMVADETGLEPAYDDWRKIDGETRVIGNKPDFSSTLDPNVRPFTIVGLKVGRTWIKYTVTDECGNSTDCFTEVDVIDDTPPTAICDEHTVISLDDLGWADLYAESLDDHSLDNCGPIVKYEVRRKSTTCDGFESDLEFGSKVHFCCSDITGPNSYVEVVLRVYDKAGNYNDCYSFVKVQNKRPPVLTCPSDKTLTCGDSKIAAWISGIASFDTTFFGKPTVSGVCATNAFASRIISNSIENNCNTGVVKREWYLISDPSVTCVQNLTIVSPPFSAANVTFPPNRSLNTCSLESATPQALGQWPTVSNAGCRDIGVTYKDSKFYDMPGICVKILRTWSVIDWCNVGHDGPEVIEKTQEIMLNGSGGAVFTDCTDKVFDAGDARCDKEVTLVAQAVDECSAESELTYVYSVDLFKDGSIDFSGIGNTFTTILPKGSHRVTFTVTNACGKESSCSYDVTITSTKKPTPICYHEIVWVLEEDGSTEVWASDFNYKSESNCGDNNNLIYAFDKDGEEQVRIFTCDDIPNGQVARIPINMYVIDEFGNYDYCATYLLLQDSPLTDACTDKDEFLPIVSGRLVTEDDKGVAGANIHLENMDTHDEKVVTSAEDGSYEIDGVDVFDTKILSASFDDDPLNGVNTLDIVIIQRHILSLQKIQSPYKLIAADVNNSKTITVADLSEIRKLILGLENDFGNNDPWVFIPYDYEFADSENPFEYVNLMEFDSLYEDIIGADFVAIKIGDVDGSVQASSFRDMTQTRNTRALFVVDDFEYEKGQSVTVDIRAGEMMDITGTQFTIGFDADKLQLTGIKAGKLNVKSQNTNLNDVTSGRIPFSIDIPEGVRLENDDVLFSLEFVANSSGNNHALEILARDRLVPEVYTLDLQTRLLDLQTRSIKSEGHQNILYQNQPNPFRDITSISFELEDDSMAEIKIMDVTGKIIYNISGNFNKGYNTVEVSDHILNGTGIYYYQIDTENYSAVKKMILIK